MNFSSGFGRGYDAYIWSDVILERGKKLVDEEPVGAGLHGHVANIEDSGLALLQV
jgi:hypothetical protein